MSLDQFWDTLGSFVIRDAEADAETRRQEAVKQMAKIKDKEGVNVKKGDDGLLAPTIGDQINNLLGSLGGSAPTISEVQSEYNTIGNKRKSSALIDANPNINYDGIDRSDFEAVRTHTEFQKELQKAQADGFDTTGVTNLPGLRKSTNKQTLDENNYNQANSYGEKTRLRERKEDQIRDIEREASRLNLDLATLAANTQQAELDREYLDSRDMREYEYKIQKDDMARMDRVFELILGISKGAF